MSNEAVIAFRQQARTDPDLANQLKSVEEGEQGLEKIVRIANEAGFSFTVDELQQQADSEELADEELDQVAGGHRGSSHISHRTTRGLDEPPFQFMIDWIFGQNR